MVRYPPKVKCLGAFIFHKNKKEVFSTLVMNTIKKDRIRKASCSLKATPPTPPSSLAPTCKTQIPTDMTTSTTRISPLLSKPRLGTLQMHRSCPRQTCTVSSRVRGAVQEFRKGCAAKTVLPLHLSWSSLIEPKRGDGFQWSKATCARCGGI